MAKEKTTDLKKIMRVQEAADYMGVSCKYLYNLIHYRKIPYFKSNGGKLIYLSVADLDNWMTSTRVEPQSVIAAQAERQTLSM